MSVWGTAGERGPKRLAYYVASIRLVNLRSPGVVHRSGVRCKRVCRKILGGDDKNLDYLNRSYLSISGPKVFVRTQLGTRPPTN